jgi:hypothetical protein
MANREMELAAPERSSSLTRLHRCFRTQSDSAASEKHKRYQLIRRKHDDVPEYLTQPTKREHNGRPTGRSVMSQRQRVPGGRENWPGGVAQQKKKPPPEPIGPSSGATRWTPGNKFQTP